MRVAIIGAGLIGNKRAAAITKSKKGSVVAVADVNLERSQGLATRFGGDAYQSWEEITGRQDIDVVVIATVNKFLAPIAVSFLERGKHVLCEKPLGRNTIEAGLIVEAARKNAVKLKTGFNHRHHPAIARGRQIVAEGRIGEVCFLRCRYGHGGRPGYDREWRADKDLCGGGELLDQGVHVVDLFRWFTGDFHEVFGSLPTYVWNMQVEDNAFALFKTHKGQIASLHTSWTQWKNIFSFEVFGRDGYVIIEGLGGSYGRETLKAGRRKPEGGAPEEQVIEFPPEDISWEEEWKEFLRAIEENREPEGSGWDGYQANRMLDAVYESARLARPVNL
ncbi:MAG: Gfo/Idh/MocA family oxidoreductase [bacterium]